MTEMPLTHIERVRKIEALAANAWRPAIEQHLDGWRLRVSGGSSSRVNSVWPNQLFGPLSLNERLEIVEDFYQRHSMPACYQICDAALPEQLYSALQQRGYTDQKRTALKTAPIEVVTGQSIPPQVELVQTGLLTEEWFDAYTTASAYSRESLPIRRGILSRIGPQANFVLLKVDGQPAAAGLGVAERGWMGVFCVVTFEEFRRQGLALQIMHALAEWGKRAGTDQVYLQVMENNLPGLALYDLLGFEKLYEYWYSTKTAG